jgi:hypothetical protein
VRVSESVKLFVRGPVWVVGGALSIFSTILALAELARGASAARILGFVCIALLALLVAAFWSFHRIQGASRQRQDELPQAMERLVAEGIEALDAMVAAQEANPQRLGPWVEQIDEAEAFFYRARQLLIDHDKPSLLDDLGTCTTEARRRETKRQNRPFEKLSEREEKGEKVSNADKLEVWGESLRQRSIGEMEAILTGVSGVAKRLG